MTPPDPFAPISGPGPAAAAKGKAWSIVAPVPADASAPPAEHFKLGRPSARWTYTTADGAVLGYVSRFDTGHGEKEFWPQTLWRPSAGGSAQWRWKSWPPKRPLYGLQGLAERPSAPVVVCEGEKAADAAKSLLPGFVAVTSPNGSKSASNADWAPLRGRSVTVWPDADTAGLEFARQVSKLIGDADAQSVVIVSPPEGVAVGWDAADALADGWNADRVAKLIAAAAPVTAARASRHQRTPENIRG
jgi:putative DNA primase/helicase